MVLVTESITLNQHLEGDGFLTLDVRHLVFGTISWCPLQQVFVSPRRQNWLSGCGSATMLSCPTPIWKMFNPLPHLLMSQWVFFKGNYNVHSLIILTLMARIGATHNHELDLFTFALTHGCWGLSLQVYILHSPAHLTDVTGLPMLIDFIFSGEHSVTCLFCSLRHENLPCTARLIHTSKLRISLEHSQRCFLCM